MKSAWGAMTVDHDGKGLFTTGLRHGDALHAGRFIPSRQGMLGFLACMKMKAIMKL